MSNDNVMTLAKVWQEANGTLRLALDRLGRAKNDVNSAQVALANARTAEEKAWADLLAARAPGRGEGDGT